MSKDTDFLDRRQAAEKARQAILDKFRARPAPDDPAMIERENARRALIEAREARTADRQRQKEVRERELAELAKLERERAELAALEAEAQKLREVEEARAQEELLKVQQKAARDARYAARKKRKKK